MDKLAELAQLDKLQRQAYELFSKLDTREWQHCFRGEIEKYHRVERITEKASARWGRKNAKWLEFRKQCQIEGLLPMKDKAN